MAIGLLRVIFQLRNPRARGESQPLHRRQDGLERHAPETILDEDAADCARLFRTLDRMELEGKAASVRQWRTRSGLIALTGSPPRGGGEGWSGRTSDLQHGRWLQCCRFRRHTRRSRKDGEATHHRLATHRANHHRAPAGKAAARSSCSRRPAATARRSRCRSAWRKDGRAEAETPRRRARTCTGLRHSLASHMAMSGGAGT